MWSDALTILAIVFSVACSMLFLGVKWPWTLKAGQALNPELKHLEAGIVTLGNRREDLEEGDAGFRELFNVLEDSFDDPRYWLGGQHHWELSKIKGPVNHSGKAVFVFESDHSLFGRNSPKEIPIKMRFLNDVTDRYAQQWFIRCAVLILVLGGILSVGATAAPYLGGTADMVVDVVVDALKLF